MTEATAKVIAEVPRAQRPASMNEQPGALRGTTTITLHTRQAQHLFLGRPGQTEGAKRKPDIPGVMRFATAVRQIKICAKADDPYADWALVKLDQEFEAAEAHYSELLELLEGKLAGRPALNIAVAQSVHPLEVPLNFGNPYAYKAVHMVADFDKLAATVLTAHHTAIIGRGDSEQILAAARRRARRVFAAAQRYRFTGASRADIIKQTARGREVLERFGPVPEEVLMRELRPQFFVGGPTLDDTASVDDEDDDGSEAPPSSETPSSAAG